MHVSGDLVQLPEDSLLIPLPWHCRAPLGLKTGTSVHVALVESGEDAGNGIAGTPPSSTVSMTNQLYRPPDLLVSVLDPRVWSTTYLIESRGLDGPGMLNKLLHAIAQINTKELNKKHVNVLIGESFTMPTRACKNPLLREHRTTLYCELLCGDASRELLKGMCDTLNQTEEHSSGAMPEKSVVHRPAPLPAGAVSLHLGQAEITNGLVRIDVNWREKAKEWFERQLALHRRGVNPAEISGQFDYSLACAMADLDARAIRLMFPLVNARRLRTTHTDEPNVAVQVTSLLSGEVGASDSQPSGQKYSILAGLLARSDATSGEMAIVCEPLPGQSELTESSFGELRASKDFRRVETARARPYEDTLYPQFQSTELSRQLSKMAKPFGKKAVRKLRQFVEGLAKIEPPSADVLDKLETHSTCGVYVVEDPLKRTTVARHLLSNIMEHEDFYIPPATTLPAEDDVPELVHRFQMTTTDIAVFVIWNLDHPIATRQRQRLLADAIAYDRFENSPGLLLIESDSDTLPGYITALFGHEPTRVKPMTFWWKQDHTDAVSQMVKNPLADPPEAAFDQRFIIYRVLNWMRDQGLSNDHAP